MSLRQSYVENRDMSNDADCETLTFQDRGGVRQINVLHVVDHVVFGGTQTIVKGMFKGWENHNIKLMGYALRKTDNNFEPNNMKVNFIYSNSKSKYNISSFFDLKKIIKTENIHILHLHLPKSIIFGVLLKTIYYNRIIIIIHEHGTIFENKLWYNNFFNIFQNKIDLFITVSKATKKKLMEVARIKDEKIKILYNFVDLENFNTQKIGMNRYDEREKLGLKEKIFVLGFVGRLVEIKGCRELIFFMQEFKNNNNIKLLIAGDGPKKKEYVGLVNRMGLCNNIHFIGFVKDTRWFYSLIDCLVIPSIRESFGIVALEASVMGVPVVASNIEGLNEIVIDHKTGLLFEPNNEKDFAEKIMLLYTDKELKELLVRNALENVKQYYFENYLYKLSLIYERFLN